MLGDRRRRKAAHELNEALRATILEPVLLKLVTSGELDKMIDTLLKKETDPYTVSEQVAKQFLKDCM